MSSAVTSFTIVMIKPSHYDDDGYPITWYRSIIPSNTLAALYGLGRDCARRKALGDGVEIHLETYDETHERVLPRKIIADLKRRGGKALICLVGVQSNQFPRAVDLAKPFLAAGLPVGLGGFHISGCISMLKELPAEIVAAQKMGISLYAGEAEDGRFDEILRDAFAGTLKPLYNHLDHLPGLEDQPYPTLPASELRLSRNSRSSFDLGRGCPYQCSFCTIINVQGRKSRFRTPDDLEAIVRENAAQGITHFFITDDNLARNKNWEGFFDRLIQLRNDHGLKVRLIIQVDTQCHRIPNFISKAAEAGVRRAFIGLENINPDNLIAANKRQNKITDYRTMLQRWREAGVYTWAGYITGFPADSKESLLHDIEIIKKELPLDLLELFFLTPLPGSEDHRTLLNRGVWMDSDLNKYNLHHRVTHHGKMSDKEWEEAYDAAWRSYYSLEHIETVSRRHAATGGRNFRTVVRLMMEFKAIYEIEGIHPLEGGIVRLKYRTDRRPGMGIEWPGVFHVKLAAEALWKMWRYWRLYSEGRRIIEKVKADPNRASYMDTALSPAAEDDFEHLAIFTETAGAEAAIARKRTQDRIRVEFGTSAKPAA
jgi:Radical SAM superfamily